MVIDRFLLNTFRTWELALILIAACATVAYGGHYLARPLVHKVENRVTSTAFGIVTGLFSFVLAFLIGQLYGNFAAAANNVRNEATALSQLVRVSSFLGHPEGRATNRLALAYAKEVDTHEWQLMKKGESSPEAWRLVQPDVRRALALHAADAD